MFAPEQRRPLLTVLCAESFKNVPTCPAGFRSKQLESDRVIVGNYERVDGPGDCASLAQSGCGHSAFNRLRVDLHDLRRPWQPGQRHTFPPRHAEIEPSGTMAINKSLRIPWRLQ